MAMLIANAMMRAIDNHFLPVVLLILIRKLLTNTLFNVSIRIPHHLQHLPSNRASLPYLC